MSMKPWPLHVHNCWTYDGRIHTKSSDLRRSKLHINTIDDQRMLPWGWLCHWQRSIPCVDSRPKQKMIHWTTCIFICIRLRGFWNLDFHFQYLNQKYSIVKYAIIFILALSSSHYFQIESLDGTSIFGCNKYFVSSISNIQNLVCTCIYFSLICIYFRYICSFPMFWLGTMHYTTVYFFFHFLLFLVYSFTMPINSNVSNSCHMAADM